MKSLSIITTKISPKKLEKAEAEQLFTNLVQEEETFMAAMSEAGVRTSMRGMTILATKMLRSKTVVDAEMEAKIKKREQQINETIKQKVAAAKKDAAQRRKNYTARKKDFDAAAFQVMDTNGDGSIMLDEFLAFFDPASEKHDDLLVALGFLTEQERQQKTAASEMMVGGGSSSTKGYTGKKAVLEKNPEEMAALPPFVDKDAAKGFCGDRFDEEAFDATAKDGKVPRAKLLIDTCLIKVSTNDDGLRLQPDVPKKADMCCADLYQQP